MMRRRVLAIGGPTASGKTGLAIALARRFDGEIVNADSRQIYRGMDVGTAKPTAEEQAAATHHLLDLVRPDEEFSLGAFVRRAHVTIEEIAGRGRLPILVGGTGLYLRAVTQGYAVPEVAPNQDLRRVLEAEAAAGGPEVLLARLQRLDPVAAATIDRFNLRRVIRAIEVSEALGVPFSALQRQEALYDTLTLVLWGSKEELYRRADGRLDQMLAAGFLEETRRLLAQGFGLDLPAMSALGYRELGRHVLEQATLEEAVQATRSATHAFIRRQLTWFRKEPEAQQIDCADPAELACAAGLVQSWLDNHAG